jgi:hypothetical protein
MKKQILGLMLSAAIFTTNPLFAMEAVEQDTEETGPVRTCALCTPRIMENETKDEDKGDLHKAFTNDILIYLIAADPQTIFTFATLSKTSYNLCQDDLVWTSLAEKEFIHINPLNCAREQVLKYWNIFKTQKIKIKKSDLLEPYNWTLGPGACFTPRRDLFQKGVWLETSCVTQELGKIFDFLDYYAYVNCEGVYDPNEPELNVTFAERINLDQRQYDFELIQGTGIDSAGHVYPEQTLYRARKKTDYIQLKATNERKIIESYGAEVIPYKVTNPQSNVNK